jgi:hypothetical protein
LAPGSDGGFAAGCSTGLVVAALKAFSALDHGSLVGRRAMIVNLPCRRDVSVEKRTGINSP